MDASDSQLLDNEGMSLEQLQQRQEQQQEEELLPWLPQELLSPFTFPESGDSNQPGNPNPSDDSNGMTSPRAHSSSPAADLPVLSPHALSSANHSQIPPDVHVPSTPNIALNQFSSDGQVAVRAAVRSSSLEAVSATVLSSAFSASFSSCSSSSSLLPANNYIHLHQFTPASYPLDIKVAKPSRPLIKEWLDRQLWRSTRERVSLTCAYVPCHGSLRAKYVHTSAGDYNAKCRVEKYSSLDKFLESIRDHCRKYHGDIANKRRRTDLPMESSGSMSASSYAAAPARCLMSTNATMQHGRSTTAAHAQWDPSHLSLPATMRKLPAAAAAAAAVGAATPAGSSSSSSSSSSSNQSRSAPSSPDPLASFVMQWMLSDDLSQLEVPNVFGANTPNLEAEGQLREALSVAGQRVTELTLTDHPPMNSQTFLALFPQLQLLTFCCSTPTLDLPSAVVRQFAVALRKQSLLQLKALYLDGIPRLEEILYVFMDPSILDLSSTVQDSSARISMSKAQFTDLTLVSEDMAGISEIGVQALAFLPALQSLSIRLAPFVQMSAAAVQGAFRHLRSLQLFFTLPISPQLFSHLRHLQPLESCILTVSGSAMMDALEDESLRHCWAAWSQLSFLELNSFELSTRCFQHVAQLQALQTLRLICCPSLETCALTCLSQLPNLSAVEFEECPRICPLTDCFLLGILALCPVLEQVCSDDDSDEADTTIDQILWNQYPRLHMIRFDTLQSNSLQLCRSELGTYSWQPWKDPEVEFLSDCRPE